MGQTRQAMLDALLSKVHETRQDNLDTLRNRGQQIRNLAQQLNDQRGLLEARLIEAHVLWRSGRNWAAIDSSRSLMEAAKEGGYKELEIRGLMLLATIYNYQGEYPIALASLQSALNLSPGSMTPSLRAGIVSKLAGVYANLKDYSQARNFWLRALPAYESIGDSISIATTWVNIGLSYADEGNRVTALTYYRKALRVRPYLMDCSAGYAQLNLGYLLMTNEQYDSADYYFTLALEKAQTCGDRILEVGIMRDKAEYLDRIHKSAEAITLLETAFQYSGDAALLKEQGQIAGLLASIYEKQNKWKQAVTYLHQQQKLSDSLFNMEKVMRVGNLESKYEYDLVVREREAQDRIQALEQERKESRLVFIRNLAIVTTLLMVIISILIFIMFRRKRVSNLRLERLNQELTVQKNLSTSQAHELGLLNAQLSRLNLELEARVIERTRELVARNSELKLKSEQLETYAFINSHRLRAPVASILGLAGLLEMAIEPNEREEILLRVKRSTQDLDAIVREITQALEERRQAAREA